MYVHTCMYKFFEYVVVSVQHSSPALEEYNEILKFALPLQSAGDGSKPAIISHEKKIFYFI